ncbi:toll-like receptor [Pimephales promelas]|nr:toll-like receptor [Pimephales promelas]
MESTPCQSLGMYNQLKAMMSRRTYLEWPQEGAKQKLFWANLRASLQANLPIQSE